MLTDNFKFEIMKKFEVECNNFINENIEVKSWIEGQTLDSTCKRYVDVAGAVGLCGGTHVQLASEVGEMKIKSLSKKKKNVRVCYTISDAFHNVTVGAVRNTDKM